MSGLDRVKNYLNERGIEAKIVVLESSTKTSKLAAEALGCTIAQIAKSIVFKGSKAIVIVISGDKKVDVKRLSTAVGEKIELADPEYIRVSTGYEVGGVPPFPHTSDVKVYLDMSLFRWDVVWTSAGAPNAVMKIKVKDLEENINGAIIDVAENK